MVDMMPGWLVVLFLVLATLSGGVVGFVIGSARGRQLGRKSAWDEWTRHTGHEPPVSLNQQPALPLQPESATQDSAEFMH